MRTKCPACKEEVEVPDTTTGIRVAVAGMVSNSWECPKCGNVFVPREI